MSAATAAVLGGEAPRGRFEGALFDQDGLLFDTEIVFERSWKQAGLEWGLQVPEAMTQRCSGCGKAELATVVKRFFPEIDVERYVARVLELAAAQQLASRPLLKPGAREILARCRACGVRTAIASSSMRHLVEHNLAETGLTGFFDAIVTGRDVAKGKPAPDIFLVAAEKLGVSPEKCLVFEDAFAGIRAARAAGCYPVLVPDRRQPTPEIAAMCDVRASLLSAMDLI
jgi:HAD superfamily hydrolase (TIGR01509 family)